MNCCAFRGPVRLSRPTGQGICLCPYTSGRTALGQTRLGSFNKNKNSTYRSESELYIEESGMPMVNVAVDGSSSGLSALPLYVKIPGIFMAVLVCSRTIGAILRYKRNNSLEERGFKPNRDAGEDHYSKMMKGMKTVRYDELSEEQMKAARQRRQRETSQDMLDIENVELPPNHPFAVKKEISEEEAEIQRQRLMARRGLSAQDLELLKKQQALADEMDRE